MEHGVTTVGRPRPRRQLESPHSRAIDLPRALSERRAWLLVWAIAAASVGVRSISALRSPRPWIFPDELIYAELARSLAHTGTLSLRGEAIVEAANVAYPALLALPYTAFDSLPQAYVAAKIVNALVMSASAPVAYALARRLVSPPSAVVVALLTVLVPSLAYTTTLMTENAFYPLFLLAALAVVRHLEQPSARRAAVATAVIVVAALTRTQGLMLVPAAWTAAAVLDVTARRWTRTPKLVAAAAAPLGLVIGAQVLRGGSLLALLGRYRAAVESPPGLGDAASTLVTTIAGLDLYVGVIPFAAWLVAWRLFAQRTERERIFLVVSGSFTFWLILQVGLFATWTPPSRLMDRYVFYAAPFFFTALVAWLDAPRLVARRQALVATGAAAALIAFVPLDWVGRSGSSDSLALLPLWELRDRVGAGAMPLAVGAAAVAAICVVALAVPRRPMWAVGAAAAYLAVSASIADRHFAWAAASAAGDRSVPTDWVDRSLPARADVPIVVSSLRYASYAVWESEFFNARLGSVRRLDTDLPGDLPTKPASLDERSGLIRTPDGHPVKTRFALADASVRLAGTPVARDPGDGATLYRIDGPLRTTDFVRGVYYDGWTAPQFEYVRPRCRSGLLLVAVRTDLQLFPNGQRVTVAGARPIVTRGAATVRASVPLSARGGTCHAQFSVTPARTPARHLATSDWRALGVRLEGLRYRTTPRPKTTGAAAMSSASAKK